MWPNTKLSKLMGIEFPIIQAPMILQKPLLPLVVAVCNAGGLGSLGCAEMTIDEIESNVKALRAATNAPYNLNFFLHKDPIYDEIIDHQILQSLAPFYKAIGYSSTPDSKTSPLNTFSDDILAQLVELRPPIVSFHFGCPSAHAVEQLKEVGTIIMATATTVNEAKTLSTSGVDVIVAQGWEAGGHRGSFSSNSEEVGIGTLALIPQVVDAADVPVIATGGIGDGRGIAAALALGASGVQMGTAFLSCLETPIADQHRSILSTARDEDTVLTRAFSGRPCRGRKTRYSDEMGNMKLRFPDFPTMYNFSGPLKKYGIENGDLDYQFFLYGQAASLNRALSAVALMQTLVSETQETLNNLGG